MGTLQQPFFFDSSQPVSFHCLIESLLIERGDYPPGFLGTLTHLPTFDDKLHLARRNLKFIGRGSSRTVFASGPDTVLKLAINPKGLYQNRKEARAWQGTNPILPHVYLVAPDGSWLEMERANPPASSFAREFFGLSMGAMISTIIEYGAGTFLKATSRLSPEQIENIKNLERFLNSSTVGSSGDLSDLSSWGWVERTGKRLPVIVDYGIDSAGLRQHY